MNLHFKYVCVENAVSMSLHLHKYS